MTIWIEDMSYKDGPHWKPEYQGAWEIKLTGKGLKELRRALATIVLMNRPEKKP